MAAPFSTGKGNSIGQFPRRDCRNTFVLMESTARVAEPLALYGVQVNQAPFSLGQSRASLLLHPCEVVVQHYAFVVPKNRVVMCMLVALSSALEGWCVFFTH